MQLTAIEINPQLEGEGAQRTVQALTAAIKDCECTVSLADLEKYLDTHEVYLVRVSINGKRLCSVRVVA